MELKGKCALVTGSSRGIGKAIALILAKYGASVAVNYVEDKEKKNFNDAKDVADQIANIGNKAVVFESDVSDLESVLRMVREIRKEFGKIDILVNNAAILRDKTLKKMSKEEWSSVIGVNLTGVFNVCKGFVPFIPIGGRIINISSVIGQIGGFGQCNYAASKAGIIGFTKSLAKELGKKNITVNAIAPGLIDTDMTAGLHDTIRTRITQVSSLGRSGASEDIAKAVAFLCSDESSYITGAVIQVDGGLSNNI